jgi:hypothetical protein
VYLLVFLALSCCFSSLPSSHANDGEKVPETAAEISNVSSHGVESKHKYFGFHINLYIVAISC